VVTIPSQYDSIMGNIIDVKDGIEVFAHRTSATASAIIPADTQT
jgi:hypothetical protein